MYVKIGPHHDWIGPYQIADAIFFWIESWPPEGLEERWDYRLHDKFGDWLADTWVNDFCKWIYEKRERKIKIHIDKYDTWSMDHTLSHIIVPMLKQLQATKHGSPYVNDEDVPEELRSINSPPLTQDDIDIGGTDANFHKRWDWVLEQMIWSHEQKLDVHSDDQFYNLSESKDEFDKEGFDKYQNRLNNGFILFGKYYQNLWD